MRAERSFRAPRRTGCVEDSGVIVGLDFPIRRGAIGQRFVVFGTADQVLQGHRGAELVARRAHRNERGSTFIGRQRPETLQPLTVDDGYPGAGIAKPVREIGAGSPALSGTATAPITVVAQNAIGHSG